MGRVRLLILGLLTLAAIAAGVLSGLWPYAHASSDSDGDGVPDAQDNCPNDYNPLQEDTDSDGIGDVCDPEPRHDVSLTCPIMLGPAAINLSDSNGRFGWAVCHVSNNEPHLARVTLSVTISTAPNGCAQAIHRFLVPQQTFILLGNETRSVVERVRLECHSPATAQVYDLTIDMCLSHEAINDAGVEDDTTNNCGQIVKPVVIE